MRFGVSACGSRGLSRRWLDYGQGGRRELSRSRSRSRIGNEGLRACKDALRQMVAVLVGEPHTLGGCRVKLVVVRCNSSEQQASKLCKQAGRLKPDSCTRPRKR